MEHSIVKLRQKKRIALVAHDNKKQDLLEWAKWNKVLLEDHELYATGTTGMLLEQVLERPVHRFQSGPLWFRTARTTRHSAPAHRPSSSDQCNDRTAARTRDRVR